MIIRIQSAGQYRFASEQVDRLQDLDAQLVESVNSLDDAGAHALLQQIIKYVQGEAQPLAADDLSSSELILPAPDATMDEIRSVLREDGLVPG